MHGFCGEVRGVNGFFAWLKRAWPSYHELNKKALSTHACMDVAFQIDDIKG
jgi:hypothetical protein